MANALTRMFRRDEPAALRQQIEDLGRERSQILAKIETAEQAKRQNAFDARGGNTEAQKVLDRTNAHLSELRLELDDVDAALEAGRRRLADAEASVAAEAQKSRAVRMRELIKARLEAARSADAAMRELGGAMDKLHGLGAEMNELRKQLVGAHAVRQSLGDPLEPRLVNFRAMEVAARHGIARRFGFERLVGSTYSTPPTLAEAEAMAHRPYDVLDDGRLRVLAALEQPAPAPAKANGPDDAAAPVRR